MHLEEIVSTLKKRRDVLGITQENLSELSGVGLRTLKSLESGKANPTFETLSKLADVLGMEVRVGIKRMKGL